MILQNIKSALHERRTTEELKAELPGNTCLKIKFHFSYRFTSHPFTLMPQVLQSL